MSCVTSVGREELNEWLKDPDNGYYEEYGDAMYVLRIQRVPAVVKALQELKQKENSHQLDSLEKTYANMDYYKVQFEHKGGGEFLDALSRNKQDYFDRLTYAEHEMREEFVLISGNDTLLPTSYILERTYGATKVLTLNIGYKTKFNSSVELFYKGNLIESDGHVFEFASEDLPELKL